MPIKTRALARPRMRHPGGLLLAELLLKEGDAGSPGSVVQCAALDSGSLVTIDSLPRLGRVGQRRADMNPVHREVRGIAQFVIRGIRGNGIATRLQTCNDRGPSLSHHACNLYRDCRLQLI